MILRNTNSEIMFWVSPLYTVVIPEPVNGIINWKNEFTEAEFETAKQETQKIIDNYIANWFVEVIWSFQPINENVNQENIIEVLTWYWIDTENKTPKELVDIYNQYQFTETL